MLGFFKYADFFLGSINTVLGTNIPLFGVELPVGISFFTFQTMSYTIDVYRGKAKADRNLATFATFVCLFPQLVAGPIVRYTDVSKELRCRQETVEDVYLGIRRFVVGLSKKILIANTAAEFCAHFRESQASVGFYWLYAVAFCIQAYFDFSCYSDMAIGMGRIFGFRFPENFNYPYISKSISEFWRRWHMTMGGWFRDYVYIPLGGSRGGPLLTIRNLLAVWLLTGFWHGGTINFVIWGLVLGLFIIWEKFVIGGLIERVPLIGHLHVILVIPLTWVIFAISDLKELAAYFSRLFPFFGAGTAVNRGDFFKYLGIYWPFFLAALILCLPVTYNMLVWKRKTVPVVVLLLIVFWVSVYFASISAGNPFMYFSF
jgi:alginate O-acetyltransferase complex protein AlgI